MPKIVVHRAPNREECSVTEALLSKTMFQNLSTETVHLCSGAETPLLKSAGTAFEEFARLRVQGERGRAEMEGMVHDARQRVATLLGVSDDPDSVAFTASTGHSLDILGRIIQWREGDEILVLENEFPSCVLAWSPLQHLGVTLRLVPCGTDPEDALIAAVTPRTRAVCVSHVSYFTSWRVDLTRLAGQLRNLNILLVADVSHSLGVLPIAAKHCDAVVSCGHKFALGLHGTGILYLDPHLSQRAGQSSAPLGWYGVTDYAARGGTFGFKEKPGARTYEQGNPFFAALFVLRHSLITLQALSIERIAEHSLGLARRLQQELSDLGFSLLTPRDPLRHGTSVCLPFPQGRALFDELTARNIIVTGKGGRLRISCHAYNDSSDIDAVIQVAKVVAISKVANF